MTRWHLKVAEGAALLIIARILIVGPRLGFWRSWLGPLTERLSGPVPNAADHLLARAVVQAALRLPGEFKCLPQALALHWMLLRRRRPSRLVIATLPDATRGSLDDLHAWVELGETVLLGRSDRPYVPLAAFGRVS